jgi:hypothetical protein
MKPRGFWLLDEVSDDELVTGLRGLIGRSAWTEARLVAHLAELEARRLHLSASRSLFAYCQERLGLSQNEAYYRIVAARMGRKFPIVFELLEQRKVHLTALALIRDYVTADNHLQLLNEVSGKTKEQILLLLAKRAPRPDARSRIRKLPVDARCVAAGPSGRLEPLNEASYRLELCISAALKQKLALGADLMSHSNPSRDLAVVVERAIDDLLEKLQKERFGQTSRPRRVRTQEDQPKAAVETSASQPGSTNLSGTMARAANELANAGSHARCHETRCHDARCHETRCDRARCHDARCDHSRCHETRCDRARCLPQESCDPQAADRERRLVTRHVRTAGQRARIPNELRRQLMARDGAGCTFVCDDGRPCGAQAFLQIHHEAPWAKGGADTLENLRLVCASHNRLLAEQEYGVSHVARAIEESRRGSAGSAREGSAGDRANER